MHAPFGKHKNAIMFTSTLPGAAYPLFKALDHTCRRLSKNNFKTNAVVKRRGSSQYPSDDDESNEVTQHGVTRRDFMMQSVLLAALGSQADSLNTADGRTVVNSILGAYGLPQIAGSKGFRQYNDGFDDEDYTFIYPSSWVKRKNTLRQGTYIADFQTADKLSVEIFHLPEGISIQQRDNEKFAQTVVEQLLNPGKEVGGDSKIEMPRPGLIKSEIKQQEDGITYIYIVFPSSTTTRSGYDVKRKNSAVAAVKKGMVYCLGASARSDQWNTDKAALFSTIVDSFRIRKSNLAEI
jgi:PsbP